MNPEDTTSTKMVNSAGMIGLIRQKLLPLFSRETSSGNFLPEIDGVRFLAIFSVIFFHLWGNFVFHIHETGTIPAFFDIPSRILGQGELGVEIFFILSGFILGLPFACHHLQGSQSVSLKKYFTRRLTRLEPTYVANLLVMFLMLTLVMHHGPRAADLLPNLLASVFYQHNLIFGSGSVLNVAAWSLEIEVQFYLLAPLLTLVFAIRSAWFRRFVLLGGTLAASLAAEFMFQQSVLRLTILNFLQYFLAGFLLVDIYLTVWSQRRDKTIGFDFIAGSALIALFSVRIMCPQSGMLLIPWLALMVIMGAFRGVWFNRFFTNMWVYTIGGMCYTIYLYHFVIIGFFGHHRLDFFHSFYPDLLVWFLMMPLLILAISSVLFALLEKPFMRRDWHIRFWKGAMRLTTSTASAS